MNRAGSFEQAPDVHACLSSSVSASDLHGCPDASAAGKDWWNGMIWLSTKLCTTVSAIPASQHHQNTGSFADRCDFRLLIAVMPQSTCSSLQTMKIQRQCCSFIPVADHCSPIRCTKVHLLFVKAAHPCCLQCIRGHLCHIASAYNAAQVAMPSPNWRRSQRAGSISRAAGSQGLGIASSIL